MMKADKEAEIAVGLDAPPADSVPAHPISLETKLDATTVSILQNVDKFYIQQQIRWGEVITQGCFEQPNIYIVMDGVTNQKLMVVKEESDFLSRCCCAPTHSLFAKFYLLDQTGTQEVGEPVITMEREGCDCCFTGPCPKPCLCWFACREDCADKTSLYAGNMPAEAMPGETKGQRERTNLLGECVQPLGGGRFKPVMQVMDRDSDSPSADTYMFAATRGPCLFGGCSEFCVDSRFGISVATPGATVDELHELPFGDFANITKIRPKSFTQAMREAFTDVDVWEVHFHSQDITPQQKANILSTMIHLDYMFFERDNDMCYYDGDAWHIVFFNCFVYGCVCPCQLVLRNNSDS